MLFFNQSGQIRLVWAMLFIVAVWQVISILLIKLLSAVSKDDFFISSFLNLMVALGTVFALILYQRLFKTSISVFGLKPHFWKPFGQGALIGLGLIGLIVSTTFNIQFDPKNSFAPLPFGLAFVGQTSRYLAGSFFEEVISTALICQIVYSALNRLKVANTVSLVVSLVISGAVFGLLHGLNPNATILGVINLILFGLLTSLSFLSSGNLWWAIGLHAFWNIGQNLVFNLPNSGQNSKVHLLQADPHFRSALLSGGSFGIEASLITSAVLIVVLLAIGLTWKKTGYRIMIRPI